MRMVDFPVAVFVVAFVAMWIATLGGVYLSRYVRPMDDTERGDFGIVLTATLTLLALLIGFTFSMAVSRYDLRKYYEEAEANAIGTEYVRAELLPVASVQQVRELLKKYLEERILFYDTSGVSRVAARRLPDINDRTQQLQLQMWFLVRSSAASGTATLALAAAGMNDVLNSQGYAQAAWLNRVPEAAWILMFAIALWSNLLVGFGSRNLRALLMVVLPSVLSISFFLIADIDSPRNGVIRVHPENLLSLSASLNSH
jgi:hypothetical protein